LIHLNKECDLYYTKCKGKGRRSITDKNIGFLLDDRVVLEEGITLGNIIDIFNDNPFLYKFNKQTEKLFTEKYYKQGQYSTIEYISLLPIYDVSFLKPTECAISKVSHVLQLEEFDGRSYTIYQADINSLLDVEVRTENDIVEYDDLRFHLSSEISLLEFINVFGDTIIETVEGEKDDE